MTAPRPTYEQVRELPVVLQRTVPPDFGGDANEHMNVRNYLGIHDDATRKYFAGFGFDDTSINEPRRNFFDLEHHLRYHDEVLVGDVIAVHSRLLARSAKVLHVMSFLVNVTRQQMSNTLELTTAYVDLEHRRMIPLEDPTATLIDRQLARDQELSWEAPTCGSLGVR